MSYKYNNEKIRKILESEDIPERLEPENIKDFLDNSNAVKKRNTIKHNKILRGVSVTAAAAVLCTASVHVIKPLYEKSSTKCNDVYTVPKSMSIETMTAAADYSAVYNYFCASHSKNVMSDIFNGFFFSGSDLNSSNAIAEMGVEDGGVVFEESAADDAFAGGANDYGANDYAWESDSINGAVQYNMDEEAESEQKKEHSDTYSQEVGVLEADIVKTNGNTIFYSNDDTIYVADVENGKFVNSYKMDVSEKTGIDKEGSIQDMYIYGDKLVAVSEYYEEYEYDGWCADDYYYNYDGATYVMIFDTENSMELIGYYAQEGLYNDVRMMENGFLYLISNNEKDVDYSQTTTEDIESYIPQYYVNSEECYVEPNNIMIPDEKLTDIYDYASYTTISGLDLNSETPHQPVDMKSIAGYSNTIYCSQQNLYIVSGYSNTEITRFAIGDGYIAPQASGEVNGYVKDQFSMSEYGGYFRIAVNEEVWEESLNSVGEDSAVASTTFIEEKNSVYVLDMDLKVVGSISDIGINEEIKSVNFNGNMAYVVTFRQTDPLYAIDLTDPTNPVLKDEFKISGYSSYMQQWSEGQLFGFGVEADEFGASTGIKMTMFDNSNPDDLKELDTVSFVFNEYDAENDIYNQYASEGTYERKALYIDPERNIIGIPVEHHKIDYVWEKKGYEVNYSYKFYSFENGKFVFKDEVSKTIAGDNIGYNEGFRRVVYIDGYLYLVSKDQFRAVDAQSFEGTDFIVFD